MSRKSTHEPVPRKPTTSRRALGTAVLVLASGAANAGEQHPYAADAWWQVTDWLGEDSRLGEQVAIAAPDLSGFGYEFESAAVCSPSRDIHGATAHFMYVNHAYGTRLSFFSVPHWGAADALLADKTFRDPFAYTPAGNCQSQSVVAWNSGTTTYLVCAPINQEDLVQMIREFAISLPGEVRTRH